MKKFAIPTKFLILLAAICMTPACARSKWKESDLSIQPLAEPSRLQIPHLAIAPPDGDVRIVLQPVEVGETTAAPAFSHAMESHLASLLVGLDKVKVFDPKAAAAVAAERSLLPRDQAASEPSQPVSAAFAISGTLMDHFDSEGTFLAEQADTQSIAMYLLTSNDDNLQLVGAALLLADPRFGKDEKSVTSALTVQLRLCDLATGEIIKISEATVLYFKKAIMKGGSAMGFGRNSSITVGSTLSEASRLALRECLMSLLAESSN